MHGALRAAAAQQNTFTTRSADPASLTPRSVLPVSSTVGLTDGRTPLGRPPPPAGPFDAGPAPAPPPARPLLSFRAAPPAGPAGPRPAPPQRAAAAPAPAPAPSPREGPAASRALPRLEDGQRESSITATATPARGPPRPAAPRHALGHTAPAHSSAGARAPVPPRRQDYSSQSSRRRDVGCQPAGEARFAHLLRKRGAPGGGGAAGQAPHRAP